MAVLELGCYSCKKKFNIEHDLSTTEGRKLIEALIKSGAKDYCEECRVSWTDYDE